ncbi:angiotensin-converting enzyme 2-like [Alosa sapidissima]|uniref:angiotensin-converting enzyme 2-like n=1 Tax=Alosa sapidissima TaxID=34773 RepID=UPI001C094C12|nr:angiotensin-converting enzyme 2-like [Alosa sapidissima]XP_041913154.1 angiotensin-converting enzyme 2-like [Alosa sapidissima]XP_041913155.1 angiotensin-converting enzyme 2-like [Alosa sapidissima]
MWMKLLLIVALAGIYTQAKEDGRGQISGEVEEARWRVAESPDAFKVRLSLKSALGDEAYTWNENELYLFRAAMAYTMRQYYMAEKGQQVNFTSENIVTSEVTPRISFFFYVTNPDAAATITKAEVEAAIRLSRGRINSAFLLSDDTLEFVGLLATLSPPAEPTVEVWLIVFGVVIGFVVLVGVFLIVSGFRNRRKRKLKMDDDDEGKAGEEIESGGVTNSGFEEEDDRRTQL